MNLRAVIFRACLFTGLVILGLGLFRVQVMDGRRFRQLGEQNRIRLVPLEAPRGRVFDRKGNLLATNRAAYDVVATPEDITAGVIERMAGILKLSEKEIHHRLRAPREYPFTPAVIQGDVGRELAFQIEERRPELPGVSIQTSFLRYYPYKETASHLIGFIGKVSQEEYAQLDRERYGFNSLIGRSGIEKIYDERLRGWRGGKQIEVNARGELVRLLSQKAPEPGEDLTVTLDLEFQKKIMELIKDKRAAIAVMNLETDDLVALASSPAFDPNAFVSPGRGRERSGFLKDRGAPLLDRGVSSSYPAGSVFKLVTALAGLETGKITPNTRFFCPGFFKLGGKGRPYHCWSKSGHGSLNLYEALERSCNVYFYNVGSRLTVDEIARYARELGLGERMSTELTNIAPGLVPDSEWKKQKFHDQWYQGETLNFAIGQGYLLVSPLQILRLTSIIAKNGLKVNPRLILESGEESSPASKKIAIHEENIKIIKKGMLQVVQSDYGTGQLARLDFTKLAAKTGTAQAPPKNPHSWITGFFPYESSKIAFVVFVEHGGSGGITGAKIAKDMLNAWRDNNAPKVA